MAAEKTFFGNLSNDLIMEIFSRLPSKSIARCRCVSKQWASILTSNSPYFTELFLTQSKTRPQLLFFVQRKDDKWCLYSCPQPQISYKNSKSSLRVTAEFLMTLPKSNYLHISPPILGSIYCSNTQDYKGPLLCNPSTRNHLWLPQLPRRSYSYFGYNPIDKKFSVLSIGYSWPSPQKYKILKLGSGRLFWRKIEGTATSHHSPFHANICINGVLYYIAKIDDSQKIVCFDLNSEEFKFVDAPWSHWSIVLVNFKGKLGGISKNTVRFGEEGFNLKLRLWVLEDVEKQEWSKHVYKLSSRLWNVIYPDFNIIGMTATGEVVLYCWRTINPLYVYFCNLEKKILRELEIRGFKEFTCLRGLQGYVDYVEDLKDLN